MQILFQCFCLKMSTESHTHPKKAKFMHLFMRPSDSLSPIFFWCERRQGMGNAACSHKQRSYCLLLQIPGWGVLTLSKMYENNFHHIVRSFKAVQLTLARLKQTLTLTLAITTARVRVLCKNRLGIYIIRKSCSA